MKLRQNFQRALHESDLEFDGTVAVWIAFAVLMLTFLLQRV